MIKKLRNSVYFLLLIFPFGIQAFSQTVPEVQLKWLDSNKRSQPMGVSWGVPWKKGLVKKSQSFILTSADGKDIPIQSWTLAYWPDGSIKWTGFAAVPGTQQGSLKLGVNNKKAAAATQAIIVTENAKAIHINTGGLQCTIPKSGNIIADSLTVEGLTIGTNGHLECILQNGPDGEDFKSPQKEKFISKIILVPRILF